MSKVKEIQLQNRRELQRKALEFYKQGLTLRQVGKIVGKSHEWVRNAVEKLSTFDQFDNNRQVE